MWLKQESCASGGFSQRGFGGESLNDTPHFIFFLMLDSNISR